MSRFITATICLCLFACSPDSDEEQSSDLPSTEKKDPYTKLFQEPLIRGINFSVSVDSLSSWPVIEKLDHNTFIIVDSVGQKIFTETTHIHHDGQYIQKIETWMNPKGTASETMFQKVDELLTEKYGAGQGNMPYKVWILQHQGRPLIELSVEIIEGPSSKQLKVSCFLRQYI